MKNEEAIKRLKEVQAEFNENWVDYGGINEAFEKAYRALAEGPQGEWIIHNDYHENCRYGCNKCGNLTNIPGNFCPNCGVKMKKCKVKGGEKDESN